MAIDPRITQKNADAQLKAGNIDQSQYDTIMKPAQPAVALPISKESQTYKDLTGKGYTDQMIVDAYTKIKAKQTPQVQAVMTKTEAKPQVQPQQEVKGATQNIVAEQVSTKVENQPNLKDITDKRLKEIGNNLKQYEKTNPEMFANQDTFKKAFSYDNRAPEQQAVLNSYFSNVQNVRKQQQQQQNTINSVSKYLSMSGKDILNSGISAVDEQTLSQVSPEKFAEYQAEKEKQTNLSIVNGTASKTMKEQTLADYTTKPVDIVGKYEDSIKELEPLSLDLNTRKTEIEQMEVDMKNLVAETRKQYEGTGATDAYIRRKAAKAYEDMTPDYDAKVRAYNSVLNEYNIKKSTIDKQLELETQQYNMDRQATADKLSALGFYYQYTPEGMGEVSQAKYEAENPDINSTDPAKQKMALNQALKTYYDQYGAIITTPKESHIANILKMAKDEGISVSDALKKEFIEPLQNKDAYKAMVKKATGEGELTYIGDQTYKKDSQGNRVPYNAPTPEDNNGLGGTFTDEQLGRAKGSTNIGADTNNYGNFTNGNGSGNIGTYKSTNGRTYSVFATGEDGYNALIKDLQAKQTGGSDKISPSDTVEDLIGVWVNGKKGSIDKNSFYYKAVQGVVGNMKSSISSIDVNKLAEGIMKGEGTRNAYKAGGKDFTGLKPTSSYEPTAQQLAWFEAGKSDPKGKTGLTQAQYNKIAAWKEQNQSTSIPPLSDDQRVVYNNQLSQFRSNPQVKTFEDGMAQYSNIQSSLENVSGPGDVAAIFQFMKTLDPTSVVRESEFQVAAQSAGVTQYIGNTFNRLLEGQKLTDTQRDAFGKLAKQYIINRGVTYDRLYDDMKRVTDNMGIDNTYLPTRATLQLTQEKQDQQNQNNQSRQFLSGFGVGNIINNNNNTYNRSDSTVDSFYSSYR